jgi:hypothetical protein
MGNASERGRGWRKTDGEASTSVTQPERVDEHRAGTQQSRLQDRHHQICRYRASGALGFLDEDQNSIQNGSLGIRLPAFKIYDYWNLSIAGGHAEYWKWLDDGIGKSAATLK